MITWQQRPVGWIRSFHIKGEGVMEFPNIGQVGVVKIFLLEKEDKGLNNGRGGFKMGSHDFINTISSMKVLYVF